MKDKQETLNEIIPQLKKYLVKKSGGSEVVRALRDTLAPLGLSLKKKNAPYKHQKVVREREMKEFEKRRQKLREDGIVIKKPRNRKKEIRKRKNRF